MKSRDPSVTFQPLSHTLQVNLPVEQVPFYVLREAFATYLRQYLREQRISTATGTAWDHFEKVLKQDLEVTGRPGWSPVIETRVPVKKSPVMGTDHAGRTCILVHAKSGEPVHIDEALRHDDGIYVVTGGQPPHHQGSSGRVWVRHVDRTSEDSFFPGVFNLKWVAANLPE